MGILEWHYIGKLTSSIFSATPSMTLIAFQTQTGLSFLPVYAVSITLIVTKQTVRLSNF